MKFGTFSACSWWPHCMNRNHKRILICVHETKSRRWSRKTEKDTTNEAKIDCIENCIQFEQHVSLGIDRKIHWNRNIRHLAFYHSTSVRYLTISKSCWMQIFVRWYGTNIFRCYRILSKNQISSNQNITLPFIQRLFLRVFVVERCLFWMSCWWNSISRLSWMTVDFEKCKTFYLIIVKIQLSKVWSPNKRLMNILHSR